MLGADDGGRAVIVHRVLVDDQAARAELRGHWCRRIWRRMLDIMPVDVLPSELEVRLDRLARVVGAADNQSADDEHAVAVQVLDCLDAGVAGSTAAFAPRVLCARPQG